MPKISVIIPTYNRAEFLKEAIKSILAQTYKNLEIIVVDDHSTDGTPAMLKEYEDRLPRVKYMVSSGRKGESVARNIGIDAATGEWIAMMDSDDIWEDNKLELQMSLADKNRDVGFIFTNFACFPEENKRYFIFEKYESRMYKRLFSGEFWHKSGRHFYIQKRPVFSQILRTLLQIKTPSVMVRRSVVGDMRYDEELTMNNDRDFFNRLILRSKVGYIDLPLVRIRRHEGCADVIHSQEERMLYNLRYCDDLSKLLYTGENLSAEDRKSIKLAISTIYFDSGYGCLRTKYFPGARKFYIKAFRAYPRFKYLFAILKLYIRAWLRI